MLRPLPMSVRPSNTGPTSPAKQSLVANLALLGGGIVVALLFAEVALRIYNPLPMPLRGNNQVLPKSVVLQREVPYPKDGKLLERFEVRTNQLGFRGPELPEPREGRPTIFFVGGSTTEGRYIPDEHAWPLVATATLAHEFPGLWGNNAGLEGKNPAVFAMLSKLTLTTEQQSEIAGYVDRDGLSPEEAAQKWVAANSAVWEAWLA